MQEALRWRRVGLGEGTQGLDQRWWPPRTHQGLDVGGEWPGKLKAGLKDDKAMDRAQRLATGDEVNLRIRRGSGSRWSPDWSYSRGE